MAGMGWGGVIAGALAGGVSGAATSIAGDIGEQQKAALQAQREERLAALQRENQIALARTNKDLDLEYAPKMAAAKEEADAAAAPGRRARAADDARAAAAVKEETDAKYAQERRDREAADLKAKEDAKGRTLSSGQAHYDKDGNLIVKNEDKTGEELKRAQTRNADASAGEHRARADAVKEGKKADDKPIKVPASDWKKVESEPGRRGAGTTYVDSQTNYRRVDVPEVVAKEGKKGSWGSADTPAVEGRPAQSKFYDPAGREVTLEEFNDARVRKARSDAGVVNSATAGAPTITEPAEIQKARDEAKAAIAARPEKAGAIKDRFKQLTGKAY